ncbi:MAG: hypothetical protein AAFN10_03900 [Bacteroidota bacterium]
MTRNALFTGLLLSLSFSLGFAQKITPLQTGLISDSSYYDIASIGNGLFWAAGENGLLKEIDSNGNTRSLAFPEGEVNLLKIVPTSEAIFIGGDQGMIFRYDRRSETFERSFFGKSFAKRCFYDMMVMDDGTLLVAGGNQKIAKAGKTLPKGFIAKVDPSLKFGPEIVWESAVHFVWSLERPGDESVEYIAAAYSGIQTVILSSINGATTWQKKGHVPALVHHLHWNGDVIYYSGVKNPLFSSNGRVGKLNGDKIDLADEGCVWSLLELNGKLHALTFNGSIAELEPVSATVNKRYRPTTFSLYEAVAIDDQRALVVGHGQQLFLMDLSASAESEVSK